MSRTGTLPRIEAIWAWLAIDEEGSEGVVGGFTGGHFLPLIASDKIRLDQLRPIAESAAQTSGMRVMLAKFTAREDIETIDRRQ